MYALCQRGGKNITPRGVPEWRSGRSGGGSQKKHAPKSHCKARVASKNCVLAQESWLAETFTRVIPDRATSVLPHDSPHCVWPSGLSPDPWTMALLSIPCEAVFMIKAFQAFEDTRYFQPLLGPEITHDLLFSEKNYSFSGNTVSQLG